MGFWAAYCLRRREPVRSATASENQLRRLIGPQGTMHIGAGFGVGISNSDGGEPVCLQVTPQAGEQGGVAASVTIGDPTEAGCGLRIAAGDAYPPVHHSADPFGLYRVFHAQSAGSAAAAAADWYASDPRLLAARLPGNNSGSRIDPPALYGYCCFSHVPTPSTIFSGVTCLPAPFPFRLEQNTGDDDPACILRGLLRDAVEKRLAMTASGGGEVGVYLSGGLDSSLIAALLREAGANVRLFTLDFGPPHAVELPIARRVAAHLGLPLHEVPARPPQIRAAVEATARALPQPFGDAVTVPLYLLGAAAKDFVAEIWNGEGGDQLFGGWANKPMVAAVLYNCEDGGEEEAELREYLATYHRFYGRTDSLFSPKLREATRGINAADWIRPALDRAAFPNLIHRLRAANLLLKGAQNIAPRCVALSQCHGLRVRAPFFDRALTEWTFTVPPEMFLRGACEKFLLKQIAEAYLPGDIVWREKRGMGAPSAEWWLSRGRFGISGPLRREILRRLSPRRVRQVGWFDAAFVARLLRGEDAAPDATFRKRRISEKIWALFLLEAWRAANFGEHGGW